jgi:5-methyltetrahydrofolate--homocysteine methyltransferase
MNRTEFRQRLENEILVIDGAMGTFLIPELPPGACVDAAGLDRPDLVLGGHEAYVTAGADIISTNTFGASRIKLQEYGLDGRTREVNRAAAALAKKAASGRGVWVAGCVGPTGRLVEPMGPLGFDETYAVYREQCLALAEGGVDLFLFETFSDLKEIKIAVMAARENTGLPVLASMTFGDGYVSFTGTDPETAAVVLSSLDADAVGVNCSTGPEPMLEVLGRYALTTSLPIFAEPNAGLPRLQSGKAVYQVSPADMAAFGERFIQIGAGLVGSCCGSTPRHTAELKKRLRGKKPLHRNVPSPLWLASRSRAVPVGNGLPFCVIGERINPTNREDLSRALRDGHLGAVQNEGRLQAEQGAHLLDVNVGLPGIDESAVMRKAVQALDSISAAPLSIDSSHPGAVEAALRETAGKPLVNSVHGDAKSMNAILPLVKRYGAGVICLAVGEAGVPKTAEERFSVIQAIVERADSLGIPRDRLICDCLTLTVSAEQKRADETLRAVRMVKEKLGLPTVLGVSNISFGLPDRSAVNAAFLGMAMASGLDAAIINPGDPRIMETVRAASVLTVRDRDSKEFVRSHVRKKKPVQYGAPEPDQAPDVFKKIAGAVLLGSRDEIEALVRQALGEGRAAADINELALVPAIREIGRQYDKKDIFLPQMILAAETMQKAVAVLEPHFGSGAREKKGTVVLCTVKGDVHDIGKNIVALFLKNQGFAVHDLGKDVDAETIVEKAAETKADVVGLSALMTTTMAEMPRIIRALRAANCGAGVIVGGAVVNGQYAAEIGADAYAKDGVSAVERVNQLVQQAGTR